MATFVRFTYAASSGMEGHRKVFASSKGHLESSLAYDKTFLVTACLPIVIFCYSEASNFRGKIGNQRFTLFCLFAL